MAKIIAVSNQKGGAGKTTTSTNLCGALAKAGYSALLVDADPQGSSLAWAAVRATEPIFTVVGMPHDMIHRELGKLAQGYDYVVIDCPPRVDKIAISAIMAADIVLIPVQPSPYDIWAAEDVVKLVTNAQIYKPMLKCAFVINRKITGTNIGREVNEALAKYNMPILERPIYQRVAYAEAAITGMALHEYEPGGIAEQEVEAITAQTLTLLNG